MAEDAEKGLREKKIKREGNRRQSIGRMGVGN